MAPTRESGLHMLADGLWTWAARHPEWHPRTEFGERVASFALRDGHDTILIDPLLPKEGTAAATELAKLITGRATVLITIPYHVRSAAELWRSYGDAVEILGPEAVARRLPRGAPFRAVRPGEALRHGASVHAIGNPRRFEQPVHLPSHGALAFGDAVVGIDGGLRVWVQSPVTSSRQAWYRERLIPSVEPLLDLDFDTVLVTHGPPVPSGGRDALRAALEAPPWYHRS